MPTKTTPKKKVAKKKSVKKAAEKDSSVPESKGKNSVVFLVVAVLLIVVIFLALIYIPKYVAQREQQGDAYNNYQFKEWEDGLWSVNVEVNNIPFTIMMHYHPKDVEIIPVSHEAVDVINALSTKVAMTGKGRLFITMNPDAPSGIAIAGVELAKVLGEKFNIYNIPTKASFSRPKENYSGVPVITCEDAVNDTVVIYIREHDTDFVDVPNEYPQCIVLQGADANQTIMAADRFVYALFNIIPAS